tara:strand:- start:2549 stop:2662 length:114 start_codon:yes stop_codon:yes gene_type:complete
MSKKDGKKGNWGTSSNVGNKYNGWGVDKSKSGKKKKK